jgi:metal-responsive CopG/Arc/MetJ family transcriptional regulator
MNICMRTAISLPDDLFERVRRLASRQHVSRSRVLQDALRVYLALQEPDLTRRINSALRASRKAEPVARPAWDDLSW